MNRACAYNSWVSEVPVNSASGWEVGESFTEQVIGMNWGALQSEAWGCEEGEFVLRIQWVITGKTLKPVPGLQCKL